MGSSARSSRASRSTSWALGGSGPRGGRRSTTPVDSANVTFEWPSPIGVAVEVGGRLEALLGEELDQRLEHQQRLAVVGRGLGVSADDVVGGERDGHGAELPA